MDDERMDIVKKTSEITHIIADFLNEIATLKSQKAALLAACKLTGDQIIEDDKCSIQGGGKLLMGFTLEELEQIQSAIEQAGEGVG